MTESDEIPVSALLNGGVGSKGKARDLNAIAVVVREYRANTVGSLHIAKSRMFWRDNVQKWQ